MVIIGAVVLFEGLFKWILLNIVNRDGQKRIICQFFFLKSLPALLVRFEGLTLLASRLLQRPFALVVGFFVRRLVKFHHGLLCSLGYELLKIFSFLNSLFYPLKLILSLLCRLLFFLRLLLFFLPLCYLRFQLWHSILRKIKRLLLFSGLFRL